MRALAIIAAAGVTLAGAQAAQALPIPASGGGCVVTGKRPLVIPGPNGIDAVHGTAIFACAGDVDTVSVSVTLIVGNRVAQTNSYNGPAPFGVRKRVGTSTECRSSFLPRRWRTLYSVFARNGRDSDYASGQTKHVWLRCRLAR